MKKAWPWEQAPLPIPPFLTVRNSGPLSAMVAHILNGDGNSEWQVLSPWGWEGPGRGSGLSHMRGTMFPGHSPGWSTWHGGRGTVHRAQGMPGLNWGLWGPHPVPWKQLPAQPSIHPGPAEVAPRPGEAMAASEPGQPAWDSQAPG